MAMRYSVKRKGTSIEEDREMSEVKQAFSMFDKDGDGVINQDELMTVLRALGENPVQADVTERLRIMDTNQNGTIEFDEFLEVYKQLKASEDTATSMMEAFKVFDKDGNGLIDIKELKAALTTLGEKLTVKDCEEIIREADTNGDGKINYEEFASMLMG